MRWKKLTIDKVRRLVCLKRNVRLVAASTSVFLMIAANITVINSPKVYAADVSSNDVSVVEGNNAVFTFMAIGSSSFYNYKTSDGSATEPADYTASSGALKFICDQQRMCTATVPIPTVDNKTYEQSNKSFTISVVYDNGESPPEPQGTWTATIIDNDPKPITPTPTPTPVGPRPTTPTPPGTVMPPPPPPTEPDPTTPDPEPETTIDTEPEVLSSTTPTPPPPPPPAPETPERSVFVKSVTDPSQLPRDFGTIAKSLLLAAFLVLLIFFPADLFNATLQSNYDEVSGWFKLNKIRHLQERISLYRLPIAFSVAIYAGLAALLNSQLSPDFGFNRSSLALLLGMFLALITTATIYDLIRGHYLKRRYGAQSRLRTHAIGLGTGGILVVISRMANFLPGYLYGLFTGLVFHEDPTKEQDGEGLAVASIALLALAIGGWFALIPVREAVAATNAGFPLLVLEAALATLWVSTLGAIVFGLIPLRYLYGEPLKKWSTLGWTFIYGSGMTLFVYTLLDPKQSFYGKSDSVSLTSVLALFFGFGLFSVLFWGYFRYRHIWRPKTA